MKSRTIFALIAAFIISISSVSASGLLDENDLLGSSGKGCGTVIAFKPAAQASSAAKAATPTLTGESTTPSASVIKSSKEEKNNKKTPSGGTFDLLQPNGAYMLLVILVCSIARLVR